MVWVITDMVMDLVMAVDTTDMDPIMAKGPLMPSPRLLLRLMPMLTMAMDMLDMPAVVMVMDMPMVMDVPMDTTVSQSTPQSMELPLMPTMDTMDIIIKIVLKI